MEELWKDIPETDGFYQLSDLGRVHSCLPKGGDISLRYKKETIWKIMKPFGVERGYLVHEFRWGGVPSIIRKKLHRMVWEVFHGAIPKGMQIDHKNNNRSDCSLLNLRLATPRQNAQNMQKIFSKNGTKCSSKYKGVSYHKQKKKWQASITVNGLRNYLGQFDTEENAAITYNEAAKKHFGEFSRLNVL